jgi:NAD(P)H-nitrite reductase large subunit
MAVFSILKYRGDGMKYGIIGFGTAGYHAMKAIRQYDKTGTIVIYNDTGMAPYNPMLTTYYASGKLSYEGMFPFGDLETIRKELKFEYKNEQVKKICAQELCIKTESELCSYDKILIATGASAFCPEVKGLSEEDSFLMRTIYDAGRLKQRIEKDTVKSAVVVGASMVGIKVVEVLNNHGIQTCLADLANNIFPLAAYLDVAKEIGRRVTQKGIDLKFRVTIDHMEKREDGQIAVMTDGSEVSADIVVLCIGTRANTQLAQNEVKINRGIVVNNRMETSASGIYSAGDCCEGANLQSGQNQIIGLWANANQQGLTAGANMAGYPTEFKGNILHNITHFMDMDFIGFGDNRIQGEVLEHGSLKEGLFIRLVSKDGKIAGANILDNYRISGIVKNYMLRLFEEGEQKLPDYQRGMLIKAGISEEFIDKIERVING